MNPTALVTGATGAIGKAIAQNLAHAGYEVILICRDKSKASNAVNEIKSITGNCRVHYRQADLSNQSSILSLAKIWKGPLHILINNAAITPIHRLETASGLELQFATNIMGYLWMTWAFTPILAHSAPARIINVASYWAGNLDITDLQFTRRQYNNNTAYRQSKQANRMLTRACAKRLAPLNITVNACHPGDVNSKLSNDLGFGGHQTPDQGADTPVWLASNSIGAQKTGCYFESRKPKFCRFMQNDDSIEALYSYCESLNNT